jgi:acyl-CoA thioester hydrolase
MTLKIRTLHQFLKSHAVISPLVVQWGDMDSFKHVNNTVYFKYQEAARIKFFHAITDHIDPTSSFDRQGFHLATTIGPILADTFVKFIFPITDGDHLLVGAHVHMKDLTATRAKISHSIWSTRHGRVVAEGFGTIAAYNYAAKQAEPFPKEIVDALESLSVKDSLVFEEKVPLFISFGGH